MKFRFSKNVPRGDESTLSTAMMCPDVDVTKLGLEREWDDDDGSFKEQVLLETIRLCIFVLPCVGENKMKESGASWRAAQCLM